MVAEPLYDRPLLHLLVTNPRVAEYCRKSHLAAPVFNIISDRRGEEMSSLRTQGGPSRTEPLTLLRRSHRLVQYGHRPRSQHRCPLLVRWPIHQQREGRCGRSGADAVCPANDQQHSASISGPSRIRSRVATWIEGGVGAGRTLGHDDLYAIRTVRM